MSKKKTKILELYPVDYPFETLVDKVSKRKLILDPDFQRKYKWNKDGEERCSKFIESCLMRIPLPACYFAESDDGNHTVIDGVQRITTISRFFNDEFALEGLSVFEELNGKRFSELGGGLRSELESTTIRCIVLRKENSKDLVQEIFARLNQGAVQLSAQEIRHAVYPGSFDEMLQELSALKSIPQFPGFPEDDDKENCSREKEELVLRFFALNSDLEDYEGHLSKYMDEYMRTNQNISCAEVEKKKQLFEETLEKCITVFGDSVFTNTSNRRARRSVSLYDLLMWSFSKESAQSLSDNKEKIVAAFNAFCHDNVFKKAKSGGLQQKTAISARRNLWKSKLDLIYGRD